MENSGREKGKANKKELLMIAVVVVLAFGLTVAGIVYLTNFLLGGSPSSKPSTPASVPAPVDNDSVVRFSMDNETDNMTASAPGTPAVQAPVQPPAITPPAQPAPAAQPVPSATPKPAATPPAKGDIPTASPAKGKYQLQLFSIQNEAKAKSEAQKYRDQYPDIYIMRADLGSRGIWYRARCCSVETKEEATLIKSAIEQKYKIVPDVIKVD